MQQEVPVQHVQQAAEHLASPHADHREFLHQHTSRSLPLSLSPSLPLSLEPRKDRSPSARDSAMYATVQASLLSFSAVQSREVRVRVYTTF